MAHGDITPEGWIQHKPLNTLGNPVGLARQDGGAMEFAHRSGALRDTPCIVTIPKAVPLFPSEVGSD
jgi:hypothetical protein